MNTDKILEIVHDSLSRDCPNWSTVNSILATGLDWMEENTYHKLTFDTIINAFKERYKEDPYCYAKRMNKWEQKHGTHPWKNHKAITPVDPNKKTNYTK